ncbi:MAG: hypothetical protein ACRDKS_07490, partial [Actinomycetota bacterium]
MGFEIDAVAGNSSAPSLTPEAPASARADTGGLSAGAPVRGPWKPATATIPGHDNAAATNMAAGFANRPIPPARTVLTRRGLRGSCTWHRAGPKASGLPRWN